MYKEKKDSSFLNGLKIKLLVKIQTYCVHFNSESKLQLGFNRRLLQDWNLTLDLVDSTHQHNPQTKGRKTVSLSTKDKDISKCIHTENSK